MDIKVGGVVLFYKAPQKKSNPRWRGPAAILDIDESGVVLKFQSQTFKVARYCVRRKVAEKDLPQSSSAGEPSLPINWEMSNPLVLPSQDGEPWELAPSGDALLDDVEKPQERETLSTASPKATSEEPPSCIVDKDSRDLEPVDPVSDTPPRPEAPVPLSVDPVDPASIPTPSDESWTDLYDRTRGNTTPAAGAREREKRPRPLEICPGKTQEA